MSSSQLYSSYTDWKGWTDFFSFDFEDADYFQGESERIAIDGALLLEIGFGSGKFLAWAKSRGARIAGTEVNQRSLDAAKAHNIELLPADLATETVDAYRGRFDTIVALDVLEHFSIDDVRSTLQRLEILLRQGGRLLLRFPNGQSPFGLKAQYGDPTHKSVLSGSVLSLLVQDLSLRLLEYRPAFRPRGSFPLKLAVRAMRYAARDALGALLNAVYATNIVWDPVVVAIFERSDPP